MIGDEMAGCCALVLGDAQAELERIGKVRATIEGQPRVLPRMSVDLKEHKKEPAGW